MDCLKALQSYEAKLGFELSFATLSGILLKKSVKFFLPLASFQEYGKKRIKSNQRAAFFVKITHLGEMTRPVGLYGTVQADWTLLKT